LQRQVFSQWQFALETLASFRENSGYGVCLHWHDRCEDVRDASRKARECSGNRNVAVTLTEAEIATSESVSTLLTDHEGQGRPFLPRDSRSSAEAGLKSVDQSKPSRQEK